MSVVQDPSLYWTQGYSVYVAFHYIGHCLRDCWHVGRFVILDTEVCFLYRTLHYIGHGLRDIWHVGSFVILDTEVCLLYKTFHCIGHKDIQYR